jgi:hypothetical protein
MTDPIKTILNLANEEPCPPIGWAEIQSLPVGFCTQLITHKILIPSEHAKSATCQGCSEAPLLTIQIPRSKGKLRAIAHCPNCGPVNFTLEELERYSISITGIVAFVRDSFNTQSSTKELIKGRLWDMGTLDSEGPRIFLARGLEWIDAERVIAKSLMVKAICIGMNSIPDPPSWIPGSICFCSLFRFLTFEKSGLKFDSGFVRNQWEVFAGPKISKEVASLPVINQSFSSLKRDKSLFAAYQQSAADLIDRDEKVKWIESVTPPSWSDKERNEIIGIGRSHYSETVNRLFPERKRNRRMKKNR